MSLLKTFRELDLATKHRLAEEPSPLALALAAMKIAQEVAHEENVTLDELYEALTEADISMDRASLGKAMARAGNRVTRKNVDGATRYRLAVQGRALADEVLSTGDLSLTFIDGNKPRTDRRELGDVLSDVSGAVRILDPYYGVRSLESLELLPTNCSVRFLTGKTNEGAAKLSGPLKDFKKERPKIEMRIAAKPSELHDRYVLSKDKILIIGHGLKDIGAKQSFMIVLPRTLAPDLLDTLERAFDEKWKTATAI
jgi:hypothetical protein